MEQVTQELLKANELRIGNWIHVNVTDGTTKNIQVDADAIKEIDEYPKGFEPIPLTHEIVHKANYHPTQWSILSQIKYVHQLQNLHFALTGKELEIEL